MPSSRPCPSRATARAVAVGVGVALLCVRVVVWKMPERMEGLIESAMPSRRPSPSYATPTGSFSLTMFKVELASVNVSQTSSMSCVECENVSQRARGQAAERDAHLVCTALVGPARGAAEGRRAGPRQPLPPSPRRRGRRRGWSRTGGARTLRARAGEAGSAGPRERDEENSTTHLIQDVSVESNERADSGDARGGRQGSCAAVREQPQRRGEAGGDELENGRALPHR